MNPGSLTTSQTTRTMLRLAIGLIVAGGVIGVVWLLGHLGFTRGFAPLVRPAHLRRKTQIGALSPALRM